MRGRAAQGAGEGCGAGLGRGGAGPAGRGDAGAGPGRSGVGDAGQGRRSASGSVWCLSSGTSVPRPECWCEYERKLMLLPTFWTEVVPT